VTVPRGGSDVKPRDIVNPCPGTLFTFEFVALEYSASSVAWSGSGFRAAWLAVVCRG
jgi:hypothetical protein